MLFDKPPMVGGRIAITILRYLGTPHVQDIVVGVLIVSLSQVLSTTCWCIQSKTAVTSYKWLTLEAPNEPTYCSVLLYC